MLGQSQAPWTMVRRCLRNRPPRREAVASRQTWQLRLVVSQSLVWGDGFDTQLHTPRAASSDYLDHPIWVPWLEIPKSSGGRFVQPGRPNGRMVLVTICK